MAIKEKLKYSLLLKIMINCTQMTPTTKIDRFKVELYVPDCVDFTLFISTDITHH